jgi:2-polyprenyl-6-methoxyphenol hydroxylase-like FAD-dependent oxidoreductase
MNQPHYSSSLDLVERRRVLISGASIAGPTVAYWLERHGFDVTVIERSSSIRLGGYPIDLRAAAMDVVERMGLLSNLLAAHVHSQRATFVDGDGREVAIVDPEWVHGGVRGRDVELPRGVLAALLAGLTKERVTYRFNTSMRSLEDDGTDVQVTFDDGSRERFDIIIGADGVHSTTRALAFGDEAQFTHPLGFCFAGFSVPNIPPLDREAVIANVPGRMAAIYAAGSLPETAFALLAFAHPYRVGQEARDVSFQRDMTAKAFTGAKWQLPALLEAMKHADDFYFDSIEQVRMPAWSSGRVVLVGDACYAPSFLTGQGSSLALTGAYVLANELARHADHRAAFAAYEHKLRPFVEMNQATVSEGKASMIPATPEQLEQRTASLRAVSAIPASEDTARAVHSALDLSEYDDAPEQNYPRLGRS